MPYGEAVKILEKAAGSTEFAYKPAWGVDLQTEHERFLAEVYCQGPVAVTDYPADIKAFYMRMNDDHRTVAAVDVLVPGVGELIGGSQREERLLPLEARLQQMGVAMEPLQWYLDLRRYGSVKHGGFGLGLERLIMFITGMQNIRDVCVCPRTPGSIDF
jgi:asparaginyl-tRNA synthetase